jgi:hypothetical protein
VRKEADCRGGRISLRLLGTGRKRRQRTNNLAPAYLREKVDEPCQSLQSFALQRRVWSASLVAKSEEEGGNEVFEGRVEKVGLLLVLVELLRCSRRSTCTLRGVGEKTNELCQVVEEGVLPSIFFGGGGSCIVEVDEVSYTL